MESIRYLIRSRDQGLLDTAEAMDFVNDPRFGGVNLFLGRVRESNHGRSVLGISYDMFQPLALARFGQIAAEIEGNYGPSIKIYIAHAFGRLDIGDPAVLIAVGTPHRDQAYRASRDLIEAVKHTSPIWKQEHFSDGDSVWSEGCSLCGHENPASV